MSERGVESTDGAGPSKVGAFFKSIRNKRLGFFGCGAIAYANVRDECENVEKNQVQKLILILVIIMSTLECSA